jgi:protein-tyrosine-phosphatase/predicted ATP-grasp superfamily ATP-dependent carboligase
VAERSGPDRILVLDGTSRAAVEAVQSLGKRGLEVHVAARADCPAFRSRWAAAAIAQPSTPHPREFAEWLRALGTDYSLIIPSTGYSLHHLAHLPESDPLRACAVLPGPEALPVALDKSRTVDTAVRLGINVPASVTHTAGDAILNGPLPRVLKPVSSVVETRDDLGEVFPILARDGEAGQEALRRLLQHGPVLEQELVPGIGVGIECLYAHGKLVWHFAHERLHEGTGGGLGSGSFYRRSITPPAPLLRAATTLLDHLRWHGVAMVEFKYEPATGRFWLMEINPRLWGSIALAIDAGVDFPHGLYCLATDADPGPQPRYRRPYYTRLVPADLDWIARRIRRAGPAHARELLSFLRVLVGRESWDHFAWTDLGPFLASTALFLRDRVRALQSYRRTRIHSSAALRQHAANVTRLHTLGARSTILFVCTGNICRSPLAAALWRQRFPAMKVMSAGFLPLGGRRSPDNVQAAAWARGVTLAGHRSRTVNEKILGDSDLVVLFDSRNFEALRRAFPYHLDKIVMLGALLDPPKPSIADPYQCSAEETELVAADVEAALTELARQLGLSPDGQVAEPAPHAAVPTP